MAAGTQSSFSAFVDTLQIGQVCPLCPPSRTVRRINYIDRGVPAYRCYNMVSFKNHVRFRAGDSYSISPLDVGEHPEYGEYGP